MKLQFIEQVRSQNENLWLLYSTGVIHSRGVVRKVDLAGSERERIDLPTGEPIEHFCIGAGGAILMVSSDRGVWQYSSGKTERITPLPPSLMPSLLISYGLGNDSPMSDYWNSGMVQGMGCPVRDRVLAMWSHSREIIILTSVSLMRFDCQRETWDILPLSHLIPKGIRMPACFAGNGDIILGTCLGEDGAKLTRIDARTGEISLPFTGRQVTGWRKIRATRIASCSAPGPGTWE